MSSQNSHYFSKSISLNPSALKVLNFICTNKSLTIHDDIPSLISIKPKHTGFTLPSSNQSSSFFQNKNLNSISTSPLKETSKSTNHISINLPLHEHAKMKVFSKSRKQLDNEHDLIQNKQKQKIIYGIPKQINQESVLIGTLKEMRKKEKEAEEDLLILMKGDPDMEMVHGLPEDEGAQGHSEVGRHPHHLFSSALLSLSLSRSIS